MNKLDLHQELIKKALANQGIESSDDLAKNQQALLNTLESKHDCKTNEQVPRVNDFRTYCGRARSGRMG